MPRTNKILIRSGTAAPTASDFVAGEPAWDKTNGKFYIKNTAGTMVEIGAGGGSSGVVCAATAASFPASGADNTLYVDKSTNRMYRWDGSVYAEVGSLDSDSSNWTLLYPGTPTGVTLAGNGSSGQLALSWTAPSFVGVPLTDYTIQYSSNSGSTWTTWSHTASTSTTATLTGLTNGTAYIARVAAVNSLGTGSYSANTASAKPGGDIYWNSVSLLLLLDGSNGSTTFTDSGPIGHAVTPTNATISTTQSKFGGSSLYLNGTSAYLTIPSHASLSMGTGDFTVEWWCYCIDQTTSYPSYIAPSGGWSAGSYGIRFDNSGLPQRFSFHHNPLGDAVMSSSSTYAFNTWRHVAFVRDATVWRIYVDGVQACSSTTGNTTALDLAYGGNFRIGWGAWDGASGYLNDYIDCFRVTKGVCRYPSGTTFTPSSTAFTAY